MPEVNGETAEGRARRQAKLATGVLQQRDTRFGDVVHAMAFISNDSRDCISVQIDPLRRYSSNTGQAECRINNDLA
jgi:hypothetical protein